MMTRKARAFLGVIASMYIGNFIYCCSTCRLSALRDILRIPNASCCPGHSLLHYRMYSVNNSVFDIWLMLLSAGSGSWLQGEVRGAPLLLGWCLAPDGDGLPAVLMIRMATSGYSRTVPSLWHFS